MSRTGSFLIGLTGSIGMGKSTTAGMFAAEGIPVWDADAVVHRLYEPGGGAVAAIRALCPRAVTKGKVDRSVLKSWVARDPCALARIEAVVHPLVAADRQSFVTGSVSDIVLLDIPLLFETGADRTVDAIVVVTAPAAIQRQRVLDRGNMSTLEFETILANQVPDSEKCDRADYIIDSRSLDLAHAGVRACLRDIRRKLADA